MSSKRISAKDDDISRGGKVIAYRVLRLERGFTLLEVLLALLISGIFLSLALRLFLDQWRGARALKERSEIQYALVTAGRTVSDAIRSAQTVQWASPGVLHILPWPDGGTFTTDLYYIDDKDRDEIKDIYWEHLNVANPVASRITGFTCTEVEPGLWQVFLKAVSGQQTATWEGLIRQRTYMLPGG